MRAKFFRNGFSLVEAIIGITLFAIIAVMIYNSYTAILDASRFSKLRTSALALANEQMEIIRNMPYSSVGLLNGIPIGIIPRSQEIIKDNTTFFVTTTIRLIDDPFDGTPITSPADLSPNDYKLVEIEIAALNHPEFKAITITSYVSAKNSEVDSGNGSLFIKVFDSNGDPVPQAFVSIINSVSRTTTIDIKEVTDNYGYLRIVDAPTGTEAYHITVWRPGYSTDKTYAATSTIPHPIKLPANVYWQEITQINFAIDRTGAINVNTVDSSCGIIPDVYFGLDGSKLIGEDPPIKKFTTTSQTDSVGYKRFTDLEWDDYTVSLLSSGYDIIGTIPSALLNLAAGGVQNIKLVLAPKNPNTLLVNVKDAATSLPLSAVNVTLSKIGFSRSLNTGRGFLRQTNWLGGSGQELFSEEDKYYQQSGTIEVNSPSGEIKLVKTGENYNSDGWLESSIFDTGMASNYQNIIWTPTSQQLENGTDSVKFQIATATSTSSTFTFTGPDGTPATYYTLTNNNISSANNGNRYFRYKVFLSSITPTTTPNVAEISFTFTTDCMPPGQTAFQGIANGTYNLLLEKDGYVSSSNTIIINSAWSQKDIQMMPE